MKLANSTTQVKQNFEPKASYDMKLSDSASAHIIQSLINLYSDPAAAVIRELSSNARDAHVLAGKSDTPIKVITPSRFGNSELIIIDEGVGLDEAGLETYVTLGESTKGDDNNQIGAYGLGCKSPLSMTSQFTVVSNKDGIKRHAVIGEMASGTLGMEILSIRETEEPNGVTVRVPVREEDIYSLHNKARDFFKFWSPGTVLLDGVQPYHFLDDLNEHQYVETTNATIYSSSETTYGNHVTVIMGNVAYPVSLDQIAVMLREKEGEESFYRGSLLGTIGLSPHSGMVLNVPIGDVELVPSRDALKYSSMTVNTIADLVLEARDESLEILSEKVQSAASYGEAEILIQKASELMRIRGDHAEALQSYNGVKYDVNLYGVVKDGLDDALDTLYASEKYEADENYYHQRITKRELKDEYLNTWKVGQVNFNGDKMSFHPHVVSWRRGANAELLNSLVSAQNAVKVSFPLIGKKDDRLIIHFDISDDNEIADFRLTAHRSKIKAWLKHKGYSNAVVIAGKMTHNPWIHENDNVTIVSGDDIIAEVDEIRKEQRLLNKANKGPSTRRVQTEARYDYSEGGRYKTELTISEMSAETLVYHVGTYENSMGYDCGLGEILNYQNAALVGVTRNRSVDAFIRRAEDAGKTVKSLEDWREEVAQKISANETLYEASVAREMHDKILGNRIVYSIIRDYYGQMNAYQDTKIGKLTIRELYDIYHREEVEMEDAETHALARAKRSVSYHQSLTDFRAKVDEEASERVGIEGIEKKYPMIAMIDTFRTDNEIVCDYINLVNDSEK